LIKKTTGRYKSVEGVRGKTLPKRQGLYKKSPIITRPSFIYAPQPKNRMKKYNVAKVETLTRRAVQLSVNAADARLSLYHISNDIRLMSADPRAGFCRIANPENDRALDLPGKTSDPLLKRWPDDRPYR